MTGSGDCNVQQAQLGGFGDLAFLGRREVIGQLHAIPLTTLRLVGSADQHVCPLFLGHPFQCADDHARAKVIAQPHQQPQLIALHILFDILFYFAPGREAGQILML